MNILIGFLSWRVFNTRRRRHLLRTLQQLHHPQDILNNIILFSCLNTLLLRRKSQRKSAWPWKSPLPRVLTLASFCNSPQGMSFSRLDSFSRRVGGMIMICWSSEASEVDQTSKCSFAFGFIWPFKQPPFVSDLGNSRADSGPNFKCIQNLGVFQTTRSIIYKS